MAVKQKKHPYYVYNKIFSYNALIMLLCGGRGLGKTFGAKKKGIMDAIKRGEQFVYLRRTDEEIKATKSTFFADIASWFPDHDTRINGWRGEMALVPTRRTNETDEQWEKRSKKREWFTVCFFVALSTAQNRKGSNFPLVTLIIFDEFIIEKSSQTQYLKSEVEALINFYSTVDRGQDKTRILMLSNSVSIMNPYFTYWKIQPDKLPEWSVHANGDIVAHFPDSKDYQDSIFATRFGRFIASTMPDYADYAVSNQFRDAHDKLVREKTKDAKYKYTVETSEGMFSMWYDMRQGLYFILGSHPPNRRVLTMLAENMDTSKIRVTFNEPVIRSLRSAFDRGRVMFDAPETRNAFAPIFDRK